MLSVLLLSHLSEFALGDGSFLVSLLQLFMRQEVLSHDTGYFFEVIEDGEASIFDFFLRWTEATEVIVQVQSALRNSTSGETARKDTPVRRRLKLKNPLSVLTSICARSPLTFDPESPGSCS